MANIAKLRQLIPKTTAYFLCDMQEKFANNIQYFSSIVNVASRMLKVSKILDVPVIVTEQYPKGLGHTVQDIGLSEYPDIVPFTKTQFSMCIPEVMNHMKTKLPEVQNIVICGIESHVCVQCTVQSLLNHGYDVHVLADGCSSRTMVDRMYSFQRMKSMGAWLTTSESVILGLVGDASHPRFKEVQRMIRDPVPDSGLLSLLPQVSGEKIIESYLPEITSDPQTQKTRGDRDQHKLTKIEKAKVRCLSTGKTVKAISRKDCRNCYKNKKRVNITTECKNCPGSPPLCFDCFFELHDCTAK